MFKKKSKIIIIISTIIAALSISGCNPANNNSASLAMIKEKGEIRIGVLNSPRSYYIGATGPQGLDYDLAVDFADSLNVKLKIIPKYNRKNLFRALAQKKIDIIAAGVIATPAIIEKYSLGPVYYSTSQQLVYKNGTWHPRRLSDLLKKTKKDKTLGVLKDSLYEKTLIKLKVKYPNLKWQSLSKNIETILHMVANKQLDFSIADSIDIAIIQQIQPEVAVAFNVTPPAPATWVMTKEENSTLQAKVIEFFGEQTKNENIERLTNFYFGHLNQFDYVDARAFVRALSDNLAHYEPLFKKYSGELDWRLIAAIAYQESHWNPRATSPTGVRGIMMLTQSTAKSVGVTNRLDPEQSIKGGVKYLKQILKRVPDSVVAEDKIWFALASYNLGFGHILDARKLTSKLGGDPNIWSDVEQNLTKLSRAKYYKKLKYGYARGGETFIYINNIQRYYQSILKWDANNTHSQIGSSSHSQLKNVDKIPSIDIDSTSK